MVLLLELHWECLLAVGWADLWVEWWVEVMEQLAH
jgi:hypothetical protein